MKLEYSALNGIWDILSGQSCALSEFLRDRLILLAIRILNFGVQHRQDIRKYLLRISLKITQFSKKYLLRSLKILQFSKKYLLRISLEILQYIVNDRNSLKGLVKILQLVRQLSEFIPNDSPGERVARWGTLPFPRWKG